MDIINSAEQFFKNILNTNNIILVVIVLTILLFTLLYIIYVKNPHNIANSKFTIIAVLLFIFFQIQILFYFINSKNSANYIDNYKNIFINSIVIISIILFTMYFLLYISRNFFGKNLLTNIILIILQIFLLIIILTIVFFVLNNGNVQKKIRETDSKASSDHNYNFIKEFIFFIPCLLIDLIENISKFFNSTPKIGYILLVLMIILILAIFFIPKSIDNLLNTDNLILNGPIFLNNRKEVGIFQEFTKNNETTISKFNKALKVSNYEVDITFQRYNTLIPFSYNYEIDCEIYINPQPANTSYAYNEFTNLLDYGKKPKIEYLGKDNKLKITCQTENDKSKIIYESVITNSSYFRLQRWNKININYDGANMDVFINSHLVATEKNIIPHMNNDEIVVGEKDGIHGGIKNVYFYNNSKPVKNMDSTKFTI